MIVLEKDISEEAYERMLCLLLNIRGVIHVEPNIMSVDAMVARARARSELRDKLMEFIRG